MSYTVMTCHFEGGVVISAGQHREAEELYNIIIERFCAGRWVCYDMSFAVMTCHIEEGVVIRARQHREAQGAVQCTQSCHILSHFHQQGFLGVVHSLFVVTQS
jgi:hypothetical protein